MARIRWYMSPEILSAYNTLVQRLDDATGNDDVLGIQESRELILALPGRPRSTDSDIVVPTLVTESSKVMLLPN